MVLLAAGALLAEEVPPQRPWTNVTTLSYVATSGNSEGQTFGLNNDYSQKWNLASLVLKLGMMRAASTAVNRTVVGASLDQAVLVETRTRSVTAENYLLSGRYDYRLKDKDRFYWYGGLSWERNRPAGLNGRVTTALGLGYIWVDGTLTKFRTDAGLGATREDPVVAPPGFRRRYGTFNLTTSLKRRFNGSVDYAADLVVASNLQTRSDHQSTLKQGLMVAMTRRMGLKVGLDLAYRSQPNVIAVAVLSPAVPPVSLGTLNVPAKKLDTITTTSLVITF